MNLKKSLLSSVAISAATAVAIALLNYPNTGQASEVSLTTTDTIAQTQPEGTAASVNLLQYMRTGRATYALDNPAIQFAYDPNFFVVTLAETHNDSSPSTPTGSQVSSLSLWTKRDYLIRQDAVDKIGVFPPRLMISVHDNPEGLPLQDWITTDPSFQRLENVRKLDAMVAGQEAWGFSHNPIIKYNNIAFKGDQGSVIVLHAVVPMRDDSASSEFLTDDSHYSAALSAIVESIELTAAETD